MKFLLMHAGFIFVLSSIFVVLFVTQLKQGKREPELSMRRRVLRVRSKVFHEHILAKPAFNAPHLCVEMQDLLQSADLRIHSGSKV